MALLGYVPLVLDPTIRADGYGAQLLEILQVLPTTGSPPVSPAQLLPAIMPPKPPRKGHMKVVLSFQNGDDGASPPVVTPAAAVVLRLRSPFVNDNGAPVFAPSVSVGFGNAGITGVAAQAKYSVLTPSIDLTLPATLAEQNQNPSFGFASTWQGKPIPNWTFFVGFSGLGPTVAPPTIIVDWHASIGS